MSGKTVNLSTKGSIQVPIQIDLLDRGMLFLANARATRPSITSSIQA